MCCSSGSQRVEVSLIRVSSCQQSCVPPGGPRGKYTSLPFQASGGSNAASITLPLPLTLQSSFYPYKDSCDYAGSLSISQSLPNHIHTVPLVGKVTHSQVLAVRMWTSLGRVLSICLLPGVEWQWKCIKDNSWSSIDLEGVGMRERRQQGNYEWTYTYVRGNWAVLCHRKCEKTDLKKEGAISDIFYQWEIQEDKDWQIFFKVS